jgi:serine protease Do
MSRPAGGTPKVRLITATLTRASAVLRAISATTSRRIQRGSRSEESGATESGEERRNRATWTMLGDPGRLVMSQTNQFVAGLSSMTRLRRAHMNLRRASVPAAFAALLLISACGSSAPKPPASTVAPVATLVPNSSVTNATTTVAAVAGGKGAATSLSTMKGAIVQILVEGEIRDPENGPVGFSGSGSGFIIDEAGTIVTNNHVVTGSGAISVLIGGDKDNPVPAKVVGVSECSDLAVIKLSGAGPYPFLGWSKKKIEPPLEIYAAGFPLGDPEYTITRGVVSKARSDGNTNWASVSHVIEHDANIQPGNSGGPLVDADGAVVGVNYAGGDVADTGTAQFFAIANDLARPAVELLRKGDQESIGVNGRAFVNQESKLAGVFVRGVAPGGPASKAEVKPGDVITTLNGVDLGGGTLSQYCKVLRSAREGAPISIRVVRFDSQEVLEGELNGKPLKAVFSFAEKLKTEVPNQDAAAGGDTSGKFTKLTDETGRLSEEAPVEWADTQLQKQNLLGIDKDQPTIIAAPDAKLFDAGDGAGAATVLVEIKGVGDLDKDKLLDSVESNLKCDKANRDDYKDDRYTGRFLVAKCDKTLAIVALLSTPSNPDQAILVIARAVTDADLAAIDRMLATLEWK